MPLSLGVLLSGSGTNLQAIIDRIEEGALDARIVIVISNIPGAKGLDRARKHGLQTRVIPPGDSASRQQHDADLITCLRQRGVQAVCLAGYMRLLSPDFVQAFPGRILNIHPSLLPAFKGVHAQKQAADYGVLIAGATVHFVDQHLDHGPIIIQGALPVNPAESGDDLAARILAVEHRIYPQAIQWLARDRLKVDQGRVVLGLQGLEGRFPEVQDQFCISPGLEKGF